MSSSLIDVAKDFQSLVDPDLFNKLISVINIFNSGNLNPQKIYGYSVSPIFLKRKGFVGYKYKINGKRYYHKLNRIIRTDMQYLACYFPEARRIVPTSDVFPSGINKYYTFKDGDDTYIESYKHENSYSYVDGLSVIKRETINQISYYQKGFPIITLIIDDVIKIIEYDINGFPTCIISKEDNKYNIARFKGSLLNGKQEFVDLSNNQYKLLSSVECKSGIFNGQMIIKDSKDYDLVLQNLDRYKVSNLIQEFLSHFAYLDIILNIKCGVYLANYKLVNITPSYETGSIGLNYEVDPISNVLLKFVNGQFMMSLMLGGAVTINQQCNILNGRKEGIEQITIDYDSKEILNLDQDIKIYLDQLKDKYLKYGLYLQSETQPQGGKYIFTGYYINDIIQTKDQYNKYILSLKSNINRYLIPDVKLPLAGEIIDYMGYK
jgi:hypothetical protein